MADEVFQFEYRNQRFLSAVKGLDYFADTFESNHKNIGNALKKELHQFLTNVTEALARRHGNPWPGGTTNNTLSKRSGRAIKELRESVKVKGNTVASVEGSFSGPFYLRAQEYGAVIKVRRAQWLTIPLPAALNADGTPKKKSARDWTNTFIIKSKAGNLLIVQRKGKNDIEPLYVLKKEVKIPARLGARKTLQAGLPYFVDQAVSAMLKELNK